MFLRELGRALTAAVVVPGLLAAAAPAAEPQCRTYAAADGHEPVCNPWLWESSWEQGHRNPYSQHTSPIAGPRPGEPVRARFHTFETTPLPGVTLGAFFSPKYPDGKRVAWTLNVVGVNDNPIQKFDPETGRLIDAYMHTLDGDGLPTERAALSGIYILSDRHGNIIQPRGDRIEVYGDGGRRLGPIRSLHQFVLPPRARCGAGDRLVGLTMRWDGRIGFVTSRGIVGVVPSEIAQMREEHLVTHSINGDERCARADRSLDGLETTTNSLSGDEDGGMYPVTNRAQYRFDVRGDRIVQTWRATYRTGTTASVRQDDGSGSTPALMGTDPGDDQFVAITDGAPLTNLVLFWRDAVPADWEGLPGRDRRIACEVPLTFGDPTVTEAQNEQSVAIRGYAALIPQNEVRNLDLAERLFAPVANASGLPLQLALAGLAGGDPAFQPFGLTRIDWDPKQRRCVTKWVNQDVSIPNGVPTMSAGSGLVYGLGVRNRVWGLEGVDFETGRPAVWAPSSANPLANSFYSALSIAPDGSVWSGAEQGFHVFRPPPRPEPERVCKDVRRPSLTVRSVRVRGGRLTARGTAADEGCSGLRRVEVGLGRRSAVRWVRARGKASWRLAARVGPGRHVVRVRVVDGAGLRRTSTPRVRRSR